MPAHAHACNTRAEDFDLVGHTMQMQGTFCYATCVLINAWCTSMDFAITIQLHAHTQVGWDMSGPSVFGSLADALP